MEDVKPVDSRQQAARALSLDNDLRQQSIATAVPSNPNHLNLFCEDDQPHSPFLSRQLQGWKFSSLRFYRACLVASLCWIFVSLACGVLIGVSAYNYSTVIDYKQQCKGLTICSVTFQLDQDYKSDVLLFVRMSPLYQNNYQQGICQLSFLQGYDPNELAGQSAAVDACENYTTFADFNVTTTVGGYRKSSKFRASPCGFAMNTRFSDEFVVVDAYGNVLPKLDASSLTDPFYAGNQFVRADNYLFSQWLDVQDPLLMSWFTRSSTNDKLMLVGGVPATSIPPGNYTVVIYNNFQTDSSKQLLIRTVNSIGTNNYVLGFSLLAFCVLLFLFAICLCFRRKSAPDA